MSQVINDKKAFSLLEVTRSIKKTIESRYTSAFWVKAEMIKLNFYKHSGHCYPDLVEKLNGKVVAQIRAILWKDDYQRINDHFERVLKEPLKEGVKILFNAKICFHPEYGLSLQIFDIDPAFTLGDLEQEKLESINKLKTLGIFDHNRSLAMPLLPQRIAIISVETSKGYADFLKVIDVAQRNRDYKFFTMLFPSLLQGDKASRAMINQLRRIKKVIRHFDMVAIVRGGGGDIGLSCYNNFELAKEIATFPIPVITGIGHATNETVVEMISFENAITPTKLAEFLIQKFHDFLLPVENSRKTVADKSRRIIQEEKIAFEGQLKLLRSVTRNIISTNDRAITRHADTLIHRSISFCSSEQQKLKQIALYLRKDVTTKFKQAKVEVNNLEKQIQILSPLNTMKRGYSITKVNGKSRTSTEGVKAGDEVQTILYQGELISTVKAIQPIKDE